MGSGVGRTAFRWTLAALSLMPPAGVAASSEMNIRQILMRGETVMCRPELKYYCRNIHVGCAGRSDIRTAPFSLTVTGGNARVEFSGKAGTDALSSGRIVFSSDESYALVRLPPDEGYIRIEADGRFSLRTHLRGIAHMARGMCG